MTETPAHRLPTRTIRFSIVVPNARGYPHQLLRDIGTQLDGDEIIVVRNRPSRGRDQWMPLAHGRDLVPGDLVTVIESDTGAAAARNAGWRAAAHPWILFLDDDVRLPAGTLDVLRAQVAEDPSGLYTLRIRSLSGPWSDVVAATIALDRGEARRTTQGMPVPLDQAWQYGAGAGVLANGDVLAALGGFKDALGAGRRHGGAEDLELLWHASRHAPVTYLGDVAVDHADVDSCADIGRKFRHYGRAIAYLAGTAKGSEAIATVKGYCTHLLRSTFSGLQPLAPTASDRLLLRAQAVRAVGSTLRVFLPSLIRGPRRGVLCPECRNQ